MGSVRVMDCNHNSSVVSSEDLWRRVSYDLINYYGQLLYDDWFAKIKSCDYSGIHTVILYTETNFTKNWLDAHYKDSLLKFIQSYNVSIKCVDIVVSDNDIPQEFNKNNNVLDIQNKTNYSDTKQSDNLNYSNSLNSNSESKKVSQNNSPNLNLDNNKLYNNENRLLLDPRCTFDNFVVGKPNELAYAAARMVAETDSVNSKSNPLFLYGGVGLGKTHLMHAIAWHVMKYNSSRKVLYMSAEKFMYQFIKALRDKDIMSFKAKFREVDVLMIDDIQFICGKDSTQEEFFHTFNAIVDNNSQMVISCDRSPSDLDNIEDRVRSRLGWGLVADVHSTTYELRLGILQSKLDRMDMTIDGNVLEFLASRITSNVRELEGALNKVIAHATLVGMEINLATTQEILRDLLRANERVVTIDEIQKKVAERYNIKISDLSSARRMRSIARPRQIAMYLAKKITSRSLSGIGEKFGKKDHTTVMHAIKTIESLIEQDVELRDEIELLSKTLQN